MKTVTERAFKFFNTYEDAKNNVNYFEYTLEYEGRTAPERIEVMSENFRIKNFLRVEDGVSFTEKIYLKI